MPATSNRVHPSDAIRRLVSTPVAEVEQGCTLVEVAAELAAHKIDVVLVRNAWGVTGLLSERDLVNQIAAGRDLAAVTAAEAMSTDLVWAHPSTAIVDVAELMLKAGIRHLPVGDRRVALGVVSVRDVLGVLVRSSG